MHSNCKVFKPCIESANIIWKHSSHLVQDTCYLRITVVLVQGVAMFINEISIKINHINILRK